MATAASIFVMLLLLTLVIGFITCLSKSSIEGFEDYVYNAGSQPQPREATCPDLLIGTDNGILLLNSNEPRGESNPIRFNNLDEYIQHADQLKKNGKNCPILYLQQESNAQGEDVYRMRPSPFSMDGGLPPVQVKPVAVLDATRDNPNFNQNMYAGFDSHGQDVGVYNELDEIHQSTQQQQLSDNPMDTNWGGVTYSQEVVLSGKYADRIVGKPTMIPKVIPK